MKRIIPVIILVAAIASCAYGIFSGEMKTVNKKAVNICMECIGIG